MMGAKQVFMRKKILVVEDHHDTSFTLCKLLRIEGYEVEHAIDGMSGYNTAASHPPDLIITDVQMPRMNGIEMIKRIRGEEELRATPILVMSAYGRRVIDDALAAGATAYIEKPLNFDAFLMAVKGILPREETGANSRTAQPE
jgi:two-component system cell cycle response regulator DivK